MNQFTIRQAENGWIVSPDNGIEMRGCRSPEYVFANLDEMNAWLKNQFEGDDPERVLPFVWQRVEHKLKEKAKHG